MAAGESGRTGHRIGVLEHLAEFRRRLHRGQRLQRVLRRDALVLEQPLEILTRQSGAGADQMFHEHAARGVGVPQLERRQEGRHRGLPRHLAFVHELRQHQRRQRFGVRRDHEQRVGVRLGGAADLLHTEAAGEDHLSVLDQTQRHTRHARLLETGLEERRERGNLLVAEFPGSLSGEHLTFVALRKQTAEDQRHLGTALLADGLRHVVDGDRPGVVRAHRADADVAFLVGRRLVAVVAPVRPAVLVGEVVGHLQRPAGIRTIGRPRGLHRGVRVVRLEIDQRDVRVALRRCEQGHRTFDFDAPPRGGDERVPGDRRARCVRRLHLTGGRSLGLGGRSLRKSQ